MEGFSNINDGMIIDVSKMKEMNWIDGSAEKVTVEPGVHLVELNSFLW